MTDSTNSPRWLNALISVAAIYFAAWLIGSFAAWSFDPAEWAAAGRFCAATVATIASVLALGVVYDI